jgi:hypothetical protein
MGKIKLLAAAIIALFFLVISCEKDGDTAINDYVNLELVSFFELSNHEIVDSISKLMKLKDFTYEGISDRWEEDHAVAGYGWIKKGSKYVNSDGQSIILWTDSLENLNSITYLHYRGSISDSWGNDKNEIEKYLNTIFSGLGLIKKSNEDFLINESAGGIQNIKWYDVMSNQTCIGL